MTLFIFLIYLSDILTNIQIVFFIVAFLSFALCIICLEDKGLAKKIFLVFLISVFICVIIPSKTAMYAMLGLYAGKETSLSETANRFGGKALDLLEKKLDEALSESKK